jgi:hypothetical protein
MVICNEILKDGWDEIKLVGMDGRKLKIYDGEKISNKK